jgi:hypothetical protein
LSPETFDLTIRGERALADVTPVLDELSLEAAATSSYTHDADPLIQFGLERLTDQKGHPYGVISKLVAAHYAYLEIPGEEVRADSYAVLAAANLDAQAPGPGLGGSIAYLEDMTERRLLQKCPPDYRGRRELDPKDFTFLVAARYVANTIGRHMKESALVDPFVGHKYRVRP